MITPEEIQKTLTEKLAGAEVTVQDMTGTSDHFEVIILWAGFKGKPLIAQHQVVNQALASEFESGRIHALKIKTHVP